MPYFTHMLSLNIRLITSRSLRRSNNYLIPHDMSLIRWPLNSPTLANRTYPAYTAFGNRTMDSRPFSTNQSPLRSTLPRLTKKKPTASAMIKKPIANIVMGSSSLASRMTTLRVTAVKAMSSINSACMLWSLR